MQCSSMNHPRATLVRRAATMLSLSLAAATSAGAQTTPSPAADAQSIRITRRVERRAQPAPAEHFTGTVRVTPVFDATPSSRVSAGSVAFEQGARAAWHTHPRGQRLVV